MRFVATLAAIFAWSTLAGAQQAKQAPAQPQPPTAATPQTETVSALPSTPAAAAGDAYLTAVQVKELLHEIWLAEYRINDLLTEVHPERWKLAEARRSFFQQTLEALRAQLAALDGWRAQLDARPESMYLGYMTYAAVDVALPRLDGVTRSVSQHENASLGAQFSQAGIQLYDLQQMLGLYVGSLLRNQDQILQAMQNSLAACQNELGYALRSRPATAKPVKNVFTELRRRPRSQHASGKAGSPTAPKKPAAIGPAKPAPTKP